MKFLKTYSATNEQGLKTFIMHEIISVFKTFFPISVKNSILNKEKPIISKYKNIPSTKFAN